MSGEWRPVMNAVLYMVQFAADLDEAQARRIASSIVNKPFGNLTQDQVYDTLIAALASSEVLDTVVGVNHSPAAVRNFVQAVVCELDALRPWPVPPLREIEISRWSEFYTSTPVARISVPWPAIEGRIGKTFNRVDGSQVALLMLRSGVEVGLVWPSQADKMETDLLVPAPSGSFSEIVRELINSSGLELSDMTILK